MPLRSAPVFCLLILVTVAGCQQAGRPQAGKKLERRGDEIVIAGQFFHTGAPVITWMDEGGYDAYRVERRFVPLDRASYEATTREAKDVNSPARYGTRRRGLTPEELEKVRGGGWPLELVRETVDQFVYHYDVCGTARQCFNILHDHRGLSVHFMLDVDGTIYQTLDVKERAFHATKSNDRSVGIEIANIGAYPADSPSKVLREWYRQDDKGTRMVLPAWMNQNWIRTPGFIARPLRQEAIVGEVQGRRYQMYDLTPEQYDSLIKLTAALCAALPKITCDYPRDESGRLITRALDDEQWEQYQGLLGHYHVQTNKQDPGPAFQWDKVVNGARKRMGLKPLPQGDVINNPAPPAIASK